MVSSLKRQVAALKAQAGGGDDCGYCGGDDDNDRSYEVIFEDELPEDFEANCPRCGRELVTTIYFDDDPRAPWNA